MSFTQDTTNIYTGNYTHIHFCPCIDTETTKTSQVHQYIIITMSFTVLFLQHQMRYCHHHCSFSSACTNNYELSGTTITEAEVQESPETELNLLDVTKGKRKSSLTHLLARGRGTRVKRKPRSTRFLKVHRDSPQTEGE